MKKIILLLGLPGYVEQTQKYINLLYPQYQCIYLKNKVTFKQITKKYQNNNPIAIINRGEEFIELHSQLIDYFQLPGPSFSAVRYCRDKATLHQLMIDSGLEKYRPKTKVINLEKLTEEIKIAQFPLVIKPYQGGKGRGVYILKFNADFGSHIIEELGAHFANEPSLKNKTEQKILLEEFIEGQQLTCTSYIDHKGKLHVLGFVDVLDGYDVDQNHRQLVYRTTPSKYPDQIKNQVTNILQQLIDILQLKSTFIHPDFIITPDSQIKLIELNVRMGGLRYEMVKHASGIYLNLYALQLALGKIPNDQIIKNDSCTGVDIWSPKTGIVKKIVLPHNPHLVNSEIYFNPGDKYIAPPRGNKHLARFFVSSKNIDSLKIAQKILQETEIDIISS
ncbi:ATP-grasp domain-containing protein [Patescibacteria group bacterium]|nr:ATP-grasp domain-containing protein [Patescibacteria group bacterium]